MFPTNQNFVSANAGLSNGNNPCFPMYLTSAPTTQTVYAPYGVVQLGQIAIVPATGAWICIGLVSTSSGITATWEQLVSSTGDVLSVTGTANQILASPTSGNVVLSLIGPYTPATYTAHGVLIGEGTSSIQATSAGSAGQLLTSGGASADPTWTTATFPATAGATGTILRSNGTNWVASTDTWADTFVAGDLLAATATNTVASIADVATGQVLMSGGAGVIPAYSGSPSVSGSLTAATTVTATLGNITATNGNFVSSAAGKGLSFNATTASGAASGPVVLNTRAGRVVFTTVSIAAAADLTLTMTNSEITSSSTQVVYAMDGATTGSALSVKSITPGSGTIAFVITNGTGATTTTADIGINFLVVN